MERQEQEKIYHPIAAKAAIIGFPSLSYDHQRIIFNKSRMFGWSGAEPRILGSPNAYAALEDALDHLIAQKVQFRKEGGGA